jgi:hypothetical protein
LISQFYIDGRLRKETGLFAGVFGVFGLFGEGFHSSQTNFALFFFYCGFQRIKGCFRHKNWCVVNYKTIAMGKKTLK